MRGKAGYGRAGQGDISDIPFINRRKGYSMKKQRGGRQTPIADSRLVKGARFESEELAELLGEEPGSRKYTLKALALSNWVEKRLADLGRCPSWPAS